MRGEPIAEDFDALSLPHNLVVPPISVVCRFQCHAPHRPVNRCRLAR